MNIPRIWVKTEKQISGKRGPMQLAAWGWSDSDRTEARRRADEKLQRVVSQAEQGAELSHGYGYGSGPLREEIIQELQTRDGETAAILTRNSYGCLVLNTARVMFVDIDLPQPGVADRIGRFFRKRRSAEEETVDTVKTALRDLSTGTFRIYRTAGGFRLMFTDRLFQPGSSDSEEIMKAVGADPAFVKLCRIQESFRARLTPKHWRCGTGKPPNRYPREDKFDRDQFAIWLAEYEGKIADKSTCRLLEEVGSGWAHEHVQPVLKVHDEATKASTSLPLA